MVASSTLLALFSTLIASNAAKDYLCGDNKDAKISQLKRSGSLNYGTSTNPLESPMLVQLVYADKTRACAGSLITVSHVLTARECVDGVKPEDISVIYGPRTPYGGNASVKSAKSPSDANVDLVVLELAFAVEISDSTIPVCVGDTDDAAYSDYTGLHFGPKNKSEDNELARAMFLDVLLRKDEKECTEALGNDYNKDTQFCVGKRNMVFAEGVYTGGPILVRHQPSGRFLQVGIAIKADAENNYGSSTRVALYQKEIGELTGCFLVGAGLNSTTSSKQNCDDVSTTTSTTKRTTVRTTTVGSIAYKITKENCKDLGYCDIVEFGNDNDPRISLTTANKEKTMALAIRLTEEANGVFSFDVEYGVDPDCLDTTDTKFHFGEQYGSWSGDSKDFKVIMIKGTVDPVVPFELKERLRITVDPRSKVLTVECGSEHNWMNSSVIASVGSKDPHLFYTPQFYLDFWEETSTHDIWCTVPAQQFVKIIMHNAELWTAPSASDGL